MTTTNKADLDAIRGSLKQAFNAAADPRKKKPDTHEKDDIGKGPKPPKGPEP